MTLEPQELTLNLRCQDEMLDKTSRQRMQNEFNVCSALGSRVTLNSHDFEMKSSPGSFHHPGRKQLAIVSETQGL